MSAKHTRLELTWIGKDERPRLEPRILLEDSGLSFHAPSRVSSNDIYDNLLVHGDNLLALKALEAEHTGKVKCIYIDPPFNTGQAFEHYDDGIEHSLWLGLLRDRLEVLHRLLSDDGLLWLHLDDNEVHYCRVILDEIFGRDNFVAHITYERSGAAGLGLGGFIVDVAEHILLYKKHSLPPKSVMSSQVIEAKTIKRYNKALTSEGSRTLVREFSSKSNGLPVRVYEHTGFQIHTISLKSFEKREDEIREELAHYFDRLFRTNQIQKENAFQRDLVDKMDKTRLYTVDYTPSRGKHAEEEVTLYYYNAELFAWLKDTADLEDGEIVKHTPVTNIWSHGEIPKADIANEGGIKFPRGKKPEQLLKRIIEMSSSPGDIVLDSFAGSGTTAAVAHKLNRRWIAIELGDHCYSLTAPRLRSVVSGTDQTGISKSVEWKGGGGFRFLELATSLLERDKWGNWIVSKQYKPEMLAEAMCKLEGFRYAPDPEVFWIHGQSTETDLIYVTTQNLSHEQLQFISEQVGDERTLLICCSAFRAKTDAFANLTLKKIPQAVLHRCEWGRDDYSLNVNALPGSEPEAYQTEEGSSEDIPAANTTTDVVTTPPTRRRGRPRRQSSTMQELPLFANLDQGGDA
jgi:adenine-specific DNA-methyltransferase